MTSPKTLMIDDEKYVRASDVPQPVPSGNRAIVVIDRGWIFAGDVTRKNGRISLDRAVQVERWGGGIGFDGLIANPGSDHVKLRAIPSRVDIPEGAEIFFIPVPEGWGL